MTPAEARATLTLHARRSDGTCTCGARSPCPAYVFAARYNAVHTLISRTPGATMDYADVRLPHMPVPPSWECNRCPDGTAWPCDISKAQLLAEYAEDTERLRRYLCHYLTKARDQVPLPGEQVHDRFLGWLPFP